MTPASGSLAAVVLAAGSARRFGEDKLFQTLEGRPVLAWSLLAFEESTLVSSIVLVMPSDRIEVGRQLAADARISKLQVVCVGGARRQDSVWNGINAIPSATWIAIHDGARPFVTSDLIARGWAAAQVAGAAIAAVPVKDTIKLIGADDRITSTPPRPRLWAAQTPQIVQRAQLVAAYEAVGAADATDDAELLERAGFPVAIYPSSYDNIKITTPEDLAVARAIAHRLAAQPARSA